MMLRFTGIILNALRPFFEEAAAAILRQRGGDSVAVVAIDGPDARRALAGAIEAAWIDALSLGGLSVLPADKARLFNALNSGSLPLIRSLAPEVAGRSLERLNERVRLLVADGMSRGLSGREISSSIMGAFGASRVDAERIARSEGLHAFNQGALEAMREVGVRRYRWDAFPDADDGDADGVCAVLDGQVFEVGGGPLPVRDTHPNCRCAIIGVVE